jgi:general secretion pathway protein G
MSGRSKARALIIAVAFTLIAATLIVVRWSNMESSRGTDSTVIVMKQVQGALSEYKSKCGRFPTTQDGLEAVLRPGKGCKAYLPQQGLANAALDVWGNPFLYLPTGESYKLISAGNAWIEGTDSTSPSTVEQHR